MTGIIPSLILEPAQAFFGSRIESLPRQDRARRRHPVPSHRGERAAAREELARPARRPVRGAVRHTRAPRARRAPGAREPAAAERAHSRAAGERRARPASTRAARAARAAPRGAPTRADTRRWERRARAGTAPARRGRTPVGYLFIHIDTNERSVLRQIYIEVVRSQESRCGGGYLVGATRLRVDGHVAVGQAAPQARAGGRAGLAPARVAAPPPRAVVRAARARLALRAALGLPALAPRPARAVLVAVRAQPREH